ARGAVERRKMRPEVTEIDEPVDRAQQVVRRHVSLEAELVEQCALNDLPLAHHRCASSLDDAIESPAQQHDKLGIFQQNRSEAALRPMSAIRPLKPKQRTLSACP